MKTRATAATALVLICTAGCKSPLYRTLDTSLRQEAAAQQRAFLHAVAAGPIIEIKREQSAVEKSLIEQGRITELDEMSGPTAYEHQSLQLGPNLLNEEQEETVQMTTQQAIQLAVRNNLDVQVARIGPAISQSQVTQAEAVFDAVYFADVSYSSTDTPLPPAIIPTFGSTQRKKFDLTTGIRKSLATGGDITLQTNATRSESNPSLSSVSAFDTANVELTLVQPMLRNFGSDVAQAAIYLRRNANAADLELLHETLLDVALGTEQAYWNLVRARQELLITNRLLKRTADELDRLEKRGGFDASPVQITQAQSDVEQRRSEVILARQGVQIASDALKQLINSRDLPLAGETLIIAADNPVDLPIAFSLLDAVTTALQNRPRINRAMLDIRDATIRQRVADNQRLPVLNLGATIRYNGLGSTHGQSYRELSDGNFIDYILNTQFEVPIGNRTQQAQYRRFQYEHQSSVIAYQREIQNVVKEVKDAIREVKTAYELIATTRAARRAAADNVRVMEAEEDVGVELTPEFIDRKLRRLESLANRELQEIRSLTGYGTAIANYYRTIGTLLERNGINFAEQTIDGV